MSANSSETKNNNKTDSEKKDKSEQKVKKTTDSKSKKGSRGRWYIILISVLVLLAVTVGVLATIKPTVELAFVKVKSQEFESTKINSEDGYPLFKFDNEVRLTFPDGSSLKTQKYQTTAEDFEEGVNTFVVEPKQDWFVVNVDGKAEEYKFEVDRSKPDKPNVEKSPEVVYFDDQVQLKVQAEDAVKVYVNGQEMAFNGDSGEVLVNVVDGQNTFEVFVQDSFGNKSESVTVSVAAITPKDNYELFECGAVTIGIDKDNMQRGYIGLDDGVQYSVPYSEVEQTLKKTQSCNSYQEGSYSLGLNEAGAKLPCYHCGGGSYDVDFGTVGDYIRGVMSQSEGYLVVKKEYDNGFGLKGYMYLYNNPMIEFGGFGIPASEQKIFIFDVDGKEYYFSYINNSSTESDDDVDGYFKDLINHSAVTELTQ